MERGTAGFRTVPHTADLMIEAWGDSRDEVFEQAVRGVIGSFSRASGPPIATTELELPDEDEAALLVLIDEIVFLADARSQIPVHVRVRGTAATLDLAELRPEDMTGAQPKAVTYHALAIEHDAGGWRCRFVVDV